MCTTSYKITQALQVLVNIAEQNSLSYCCIGAKHFWSSHCSQLWLVLEGTVVRLDYCNVSRFTPGPPMVLPVGGCARVVEERAK